MSFPFHLSCLCCFPTAVLPHFVHVKSFKLGPLLPHFSAATPIPHRLQQPQLYKRAAERDCRAYTQQHAQLRNTEDRHVQRPESTVLPSHLCILNHNSQRSQAAIKLYFNYAEAFHHTSMLCSSLTRGRLRCDVAKTGCCVAIGLHLVSNLNGFN